MTTNSKLQTINGYNNKNRSSTVVDKLPNTRFTGMGFFHKYKNKSYANTDNGSMFTDRAHKADDENSYVLDEKSTVDEENSNASKSTIDVLSVSANSSSNFSFNTHGESGDAYPALYNPEMQAQYEQMKIEEEKKKRDSRWGPASGAVDYVSDGMGKIFAYVESWCVYDVKAN